MTTQQDPTTQPTSAPTPTRSGLSLDWWAVIVAVVLVVLIWSGLIPAVAW
jgi:hypothetical protein